MRDEICILQRSFLTRSADKPKWILALTIARNDAMILWYIFSRKTNPCYGELRRTSFQERESRSMNQEDDPHANLGLIEFKQHKFGDDISANRRGKFKRSSLCHRRMLLLGIGTSTVLARNSSMCLLFSFS